MLTFKANQTQLRDLPPTQDSERCFTADFFSHTARKCSRVICSLSLDNSLNASLKCTKKGKRLFKTIKMLKKSRNHCCHGVC